MLEIDVLRNYFTKDLGVLRVNLLGCPDALLAETMMELLLAVDQWQRLGLHSHRGWPLHFHGDFLV